MLTRCAWVPSSDPLYIDYHDREWGVPVRQDRKIFEFLVLESAQAGLSWITVLRKRNNYRRAFADFDPVQVAAFTPADVDRLVVDAGIIRNRKKIEAAINNASLFLEVAREFGSFSSYIWQFVDNRPLQPARAYVSDVPAITPQAEHLSRDLKSRGFKFLGPTVVYAHMQATGMVNDHTLDCFRHPQLS